MSDRILTYPGCAVSMCGGVGILLWTGEPSLAANQWAVRTILSLQGKSPSAVTLLQIVAASAGTPDAETRAYIQDVYRRELSGVRRLVSAPLGDSFRQSVVRTIMRGMAVFAGKSAHMTVVSTLPQAYAAILDGRTEPSRPELEARVSEMFVALGAVAP